MFFKHPFLLFSTTLVSASSVPSWYQYVRAPSSNIVRPKAILHTNGSVSNAEAIINGHGVATLSRPSTGSEVPSITIDFGLNIVGFVQIHFAGASDNHPGVRLAFSETLEYLTNVSDFTRSDNGDTITPGTDQFSVPSTATTWTDHHGCLYNGTKVCADGLHGFRYMWIKLDALASDAPYTEPNGTVKISAVDLKFYGFLGHPDTYTGHFECSSNQLTQWWFDASYTTEMVTAIFTQNTSDPRDANSPTLDGKLVLQDGAKRDRDPYDGDIAVSGRTTYLTHSQNAVAAKNVIGDLANHQRADGWIPPASINNYTLPLFDYPMWWVVDSWEYVLYSGDTDYATQFWPNLLRVLNDWYPSVTNSSSGLLSKGLNGTEGYGDYAFLPRTGEVTYYNALYVYALQNAAMWAIHLGQPSTATSWSSRASQVLEAINKNLWDPSVGAYFDSLNFTTSYNQPRHAQDGNSLAILTGVASGTRAESALDYISTHMSQPYGNAFYDGPLPGVDNATERVYAFLSFFELQGRFLTPNFSASAIDEIDRLYGWMATHDPTITNWEGIGPGGNPYEQGYTSMAHGWSTGMVSLGSNYILGVQPTGPGFETWSVKPYPSGLKWANGSVGTPKGRFNVNWSIENDQFQMILDVPSSSNGTISVPVSDGQLVYLDGKILHKQTSDGYMILEGIGSGQHQVNVK